MTKKGENAGGHNMLSITEQVFVQESRLLDIFTLVLGHFKDNYRTARAFLGPRGQSGVPGRYLLERSTLLELYTHTAPEGDAG